MESERGGESGIKIKITYMKRLLLLLLLLPLLGIAQTTIITKDLDTIVQTKQQVLKSIKVGALSYKDSVIRYDTIIQIVKKYVPPGNTNLPPTARAGADQNLIITVSGTSTSTRLDATGSTDPEGATLKYFWRQTSGVAVTLVDTNKAVCSVSNMGVGVYEFEVRAVDPLNAFTADRIVVTVKKEVVTPPDGSPVPFSLSQLAVGDPDLNRPGAGAEQWHDRQDVNLGYSSADVYWRFAATRIAGTSKGTYNWSFFDKLFDDAKAKKQKVSFGIMTLYPEGKTDVGLVAFDGGYACYPLWLHLEMQAESVKDWRTGPTWTPNYNSQKYLTWLADLNKAINDHIYAKGYQNMVNVIDIRGYGAWGEWHSGYTPNNVISDYPSGTFPTTATLKAIVDAHINGFPNFQLNCMIAAFDANYLGNTKNPPEIAYYILTHPGNNKGKIGWRRDQWGALDDYLKAYLENNTRSFNGVTFNTLIMDRWKTAPITGEPPGWNPNDYGDLERQVKLYHATSFGNGNYGGGSAPPGSGVTRVKAASKSAGYRLTATGGTFTPGETSISITTNWQNTGLSPTYEDWNITYELVNSSGTVTTLGVSTFKLRLFLPTNAVTAYTDVFPLSAPAGSYTLRIVVKDPGGYRAPLTLQLQGRNTDGSYNIKTFNR